MIFQIIYSCKVFYLFILEESFQIYWNDSSINILRGYFTIFKGIFKDFRVFFNNYYLTFLNIAKVYFCSIVLFDSRHTIESKEKICPINILWSFQKLGL